MCFCFHHLKIYGSLKHKEGICVRGSKREQRGNLRHLSINHYLTLFPNGLLHLLVTLTGNGREEGGMYTVQYTLLQYYTERKAKLKAWKQRIRNKSMTLSRVQSFANAEQINNLQSHSFYNGLFVCNLIFQQNDTCC